MSKPGIVPIHGKDYKTVALRVHEFRETHSIDDGWGIIDHELPAPEGYVKVAARIVDPEGRPVATGLAEERRDASQINKTSALENCATSAIGRALAAAGYGGTEFASANEVENAVHQQKERVEETHDRITPIEPKSDIPDDILDIVMENVDIGTKLLTKEVYQIWHGRIRGNYFEGKSVDDMSKEELADFAYKQNERFKLEKE